MELTRPHAADVKAVRVTPQSLNTSHTTTRTRAYLHPALSVRFSPVPWLFAITTLRINIISEASKELVQGETEWTLECAVSAAPCSVQSTSTDHTYTSESEEGCLSM